MLTFALFIAYLGSTEPSVKATSTSDHVQAAIVAAVRQRMGNDIDVAVDDLSVQIAPGASVIEAVPEPGARLDGQIRFILRWSGAERSGARVLRSGAAVARIRVVVPHAHSTAILTRGTTLDADHIAEARHEIVSGALRPLPTLADSLGSKLLRDLPADACIVRGAIVNQPDVKTGQDVVAMTHVDGMQVSATLVAADSGDAGSTIRVVNRQSRRTLKARVLSPGVVEVIK